MGQHARLLRGALLIVSLLTLSGLHVQQDQRPSGWRAGTLLPLALGLIFTISSVGYTVTANSALAVLSSLPTNVFSAFSLLVLVHLLRHRRRLHMLLMRLTRLEKLTSLNRRSGDYTFVKVQFAVLGIIKVCAFVNWIVTFFARGEFSHPNYLNSILVPVFLRSPVRYWLVVGLQLVSNVIMLLLSLLFDLMFITLADACALFLRRLSRYCRRHLDDRRVGYHFSGAEEASAVDEDEALSEGVNLAGSTPKQDRRTGIHAKEQRNAGSVHAVRISPWPYSQSHQVPTWQGDAPLNSGSVSEDHLPSPPCSPEYHLRHLRQLYASVRCFTSASAAFCSPLTFGLHFNATATLLIGLYVTIALISGGAGLKSSLGYTLFLLLEVVRLAAVAAAGSRLGEQSQRLHDTLAGSRWSAGVSSEDRFTLQMLLELTRQPPVFDGWGLFTVHKPTVLSLFGFVLTYFFIMLQLNITGIAGG